MSAYLSAALMLGLAVGGALVAQLVHRRTAVAPDAVPALPFLSGWRPAEHALSRYEARYYPMTLLFLAFDVEMLFMYPWATVVASIGVSAIIEMFVLLGVLMAGVLWAWREGALQWA
ncbi:MULTISPECIES: NADH-quinone oxidoreductase subunit A [unclassified Modestobacter]